jgi:hypothetical protein
MAGASPAMTVNVIDRLRHLPSDVVAIKAMTGYVASLVKTAWEHFGKSKEKSERKRYDQFVLSRPVKKYYPITLYRNFTRN